MAQVILFYESGQKKTIGARAGSDFEKIAARLVPQGVDWQIIDADDIPPPDPAEAIAAERAAMVCSRPQAKIAMGPEMWSAVLAIRDDPETPWPLRVWIDDFTELRRMSDTTINLAAALGLADEQVDDLFRAAMGIEA